MRCIENVKQNTEKLPDPLAHLRYDSIRPIDLGRLVESMLSDILEGDWKSKETLFIKSKYGINNSNKRYYS